MKQQSAGIVREKVEEICTLVPAFRKEIDWGRGQTQEGKDYCQYVFKSGSYFDNLAARESSRGKRRQGKISPRLFWTREIIIIIINLKKLNKLPWINCGIKRESWNANPNRRLIKYKSGATHRRWKDIILPRGRNLQIARKDMLN